MREKKELNIQVGEQVRNAREKSKLTQEQLAELIDVSPQYISDLERGVVGISVATLKKLCVATNIQSDRILFGRANQERIDILGNMCEDLSDEQFQILMDVVKCFKKAVNI